MVPTMSTLSHFINRVSAHSQYFSGLKLSADKSILGCPCLRKCVFRLAAAILSYNSLLQKTSVNCNYMCKFLKCKFVAPTVATLYCHYKFSDDRNS